ncbi:hypothetical protein D9M73_268730 [compost metagenome]
MVGRHARKVAAIGLHFLQAVEVRIVAIGAAAHPQGAELAAEGQCGQVALATPAGHQGVAGDAFLGGGRRGETQVEVALLGGELAERAHGHAVGHGQSSVHCT